MREVAGLLCMLALLRELVSKHLTDDARFNFCTLANFVAQPRGNQLRFDWLAAVNIHFHIYICEHFHIYVDMRHLYMARATPHKE